MANNLNCLCYESKFLVTPHGCGGGGLTLLWKNEVELEVLLSNHNFIDTKIKYKESHFYATFVYREPNLTKRKLVWDILCAIAQHRNDPWFLTRDFNEIADNSEKNRESTRAENTFVDFRSFIFASNLYDLQHSGNFLSWRGVRYQHTILCRLDRSMENCTWMENFPAARSEYLQF